MKDKTKIVAEVPSVVGMAIRLRAAKLNCTVGAVIERAIHSTYPEELMQATEETAKQAIEHT